MFDGTNDSLQSASAIDLSGTNKISVAFWLWWDTFAGDNDLALEFSPVITSGAGVFHVNPNESSTGRINLAVFGNVGFNMSDYTRPSAAAWHHWVCLFDMSQATNECDLYLDGALQTAVGHVASSNNTGNFANQTLNVMSRNNASNFGAGRMADLAIWPGEVLNASEALALFRGVRPFRIRPGSNPYYWPLNGLQSPEPTWRSGGPALTVNGAVQTSHAPVRPFTRMERANYEEIVAAAGGVPRHYMYYQRLRAA